MRLRVFYGEKCKDIGLAASGGVAIGKHTKGGLDIDGSALLDRHIVFCNEHDVWRVVCNGDVICDDELYNKKKPYSATVEPYKKFVLSPEDRISCIVLHDDVRQTTVDLAVCDEVLVGRKPGSNVLLRYSLVSGKHAQIKRIGNEFQIEDLGSTNGTYVNGEQVSSAILRDGDVICIGEATLVYRSGVLDIQSNFCTLDMPKRSTPDPMATRVNFERSPRLKLAIPQGDVDIQSPPPIGAKPTINWVQVILPSLGTVGVAAIVTLVSGMNPMMLAFSAPMAIIGIIVSIINYRGQTKKYREQQEKRLATYTEYLDGVIAGIKEKRSKQIQALTTADPETVECLRIVKNLDKRLWERRPTDADFMSVRLGGGDLPLSVNIKYPQQGLALEEDNLLARPKEIYEEYSVVHGMPVVCPALKCSTIGIVGASDKTMALLSNMIVQLTTHHSYSEMKCILFCSKTQSNALDWVKKLPNFCDEERKSVYVATNREDAGTLCSAFEKELKGRLKDAEEEQDQYAQSIRLPYFVFFIADSSLLEGETIRRYLLNHGKELGICTVMLYDQVQSLPKECGTIIELRENSGELYSKERASERSKFDLDSMSDAQYGEFAGVLGNIFCEENSAEAGITSSISLFEVLGLQSLEQLNLQKNWALSNVAKSLAAPLGVKEKNELVYLDLHEGAHGPHGLVAGTTGSGKSEIMQSYVLAMAANFHPYEVGFVIIDFKGGGMVNQFKDLPHLIGAITDMDGKEVTRSLLSIKAELDKRKRLFAEHGVNKIDQYIELFKTGGAKEPLPHLVIIVDEFAELKADQPEFMQELISAARIGRSLGVHLILATQKPAGQVNEQIWSNSKFKLCLKVQDASDSREVLKSPLAAKIKEPGRAYLKVGNDEVFELLQSGYSGVKTQYNGQSVTELAGMVQHIKDYCERSGIPRLKPICLPPLPQLLTYPAEMQMTNSLIPVGIYDAPSAQKQGSAMLNIAENTFVVGSAQMGKTNLLQSLIRTAAWTLSPAEINFYIMDFGAMTLKSFEGLNHVGGVVLPDEDEKLKNLFKLLEREIEQRKKKMIANGVSSFQAYIEGGFIDLPRIVLILDGFVAFNELYGEEYEGALQHICRDGLSYGITAVITNTQTTGFGYRYLSLFKDRIAFTCNDASEYSSLFDRCRTEPSNISGRFLRCIEGEIYEAQAFLAFEGQREIERTAAMKAFVQAANERHPNESATKIPAIPDHLDLDYIKANYHPVQAQYEYILGLDYEGVDIVSCDFNTICELVIAGSMSLKKRATVRALISALQQKSEEAPVELHIIDSIERPLKPYGDHQSVKTYSIDFSEAGNIIDDFYDAVQKRYDILVHESIEALSKFPLLVGVFNNSSVIEFISSNSDLFEKYKKIAKQGQSLKILFIFSDLEGGSVSFGSPDLLKTLRGAKNMIIADNLREFQFAEISTAVIRASKPLQEGDVYCMQNGVIKRIKLCGGELS